MPAWVQPLLELIGLLAVIFALVPPLASLFNRRSDEVDIRKPLHRPPKRYRGR